jgi:hypothetical protein
VDDVSRETKDLLLKMALRQTLAQEPRRQEVAGDGDAFTTREEERLAALRWTIADGQGWFSLKDSARSRLEEAVVARLADIVYGAPVPPAEEATADGQARARPVLPADLVKGATVCRGFGGGHRRKIAASIWEDRGQDDLEVIAREAMLLAGTDARGERPVSHHAAVRPGA